MKKNLTLIKNYIAAIKFDHIIKKMVDEQGWKKKHAVVACQQYKNMLYLWFKYQENTEMLPPSKDIDEVWHHHILHTREYIQDCEFIFGHYLHHVPYPRSTMDTTSQLAMQQAFKRTLDLYEQEFGESLSNARPQYFRKIKFLIFTTFTNYTLIIRKKRFF